MKLDRRGFIKFMAGGALGTFLSPIPWKLIDDVAIWTQNWPWVPNPPRGETLYRNTITPFAYNGSGVTVRMVDGAEGRRAIRLCGTPDNPLNHGTLGPMDTSGLQYRYNQAIRVPSPMKFDGKTYRPISWEDALGLLVEKLQTLRSEGRPESVAVIAGPGRNTINEMLERFLRAYGSPNYLTMPGAVQTDAQVLKLMFGARGTMGYDLEHADYLVSFGCGFLEGWGSQQALSAFRRLRESNPDGLSKVIQVATNCSITSTQADEWLAVAPGTEGALALGMAHVILKDDLANRSFLEGNAFGLSGGMDSMGTPFAGFRKWVLNEYGPDRVSEITGVPADRIVQAAWGLARSKRGLALPGRGKGTMPGSLYEFMAVHSLNALVGAVNRTGGVGPVSEPPWTPWPRLDLDGVAERGLGRARVDQAGAFYPFAESLLNAYAQAVLDQKESPVELLLLHGCNPSHNAPNAKEFNRALDKAPFVVCFSPYWSETALRADLILPDHAFLERFEDGIPCGGVPYPAYVVGAPLFPPMLDTRASGDVVLRTAKALGGSLGAAFPWSTYEEVIRYRAEGIYRSQKGLISEPGTLGNPETKGFAGFAEFWKNLTAHGCWYDPDQRIGKTSMAFDTPSGKFEFYSNRIRGRVRDRGEDAFRKDLKVSAAGEMVCMAHYEEVSPVGDPRAFPLLMMPEEPAYTHESEVPSSPYMTKIWPDTLLKGKHLVVHLNPETASEYRLKEGDLAVMESLSGSAEVRVHLFHGVRPGVVVMAEGFGHTAFDEYIKGKGSNTREMTTVCTDPLSGMPLWWGTRVKIWKA